MHHYVVLSVFTDIFARQNPKKLFLKINAFILIIPAFAVKGLNYATTTDKLRLLFNIPTYPHTNLACQTCNQAEAGDMTEWLGNRKEFWPPIRESILIAHVCRTDCAH